MIIKVVRGDYFPGLVDYIMRWGQYASTEETPRVLAHPGLFSAKTAAAELWLQASLAPDRTQRAIHFIGRAEKGLADEQYRETARRILAAANLSNRPYLLVLHDDDGHFHLATVEVDERGAPPPRRIVSRSLRREVTPDLIAILPHGDVTSRSWDSHLAWRLTKVSRQVEIDFGLRRLGADRDSFDKVRIPIWQLKKEAEQGLTPLASALGDQIKDALDMPTWQERSDALAMLGLGLRPYEGSNKRRQGLQVFALGEPTHFCNASQLGKAYGLGTLEKRSEGQFREWFNRQAPAISSAETSVSGHRSFHKLGSSDPALLRLKQDFDDYRRTHREAKKRRRDMSSGHRNERRKDRAVVDLVRERLLATGRVSKSWARVISQIVRQELQAKTLARQLREKASLLRMGKRQLRWPEFLARAAAHDADAHRVHEQVRRKLSPHERSIERERAFSDASARNDQHDHLVQQAQAIEAEAYESAVRRESELQIEEERFAAYQRRKRLRALEPELVEKVRLESAEDWVPVMAFLDKRPQDLDAIMHSSVRNDVNVMMASILDEQTFRLRKVLKFVASVGDRSIFRVDRIVAMNVKDVELRSYVRTTADWTEVKNAVRERDAVLRVSQQALSEESPQEAQGDPMTVEQPIKPSQTEPVAASGQHREGDVSRDRAGHSHRSASDHPDSHKSHFSCPAEGQSQRSVESAGENIVDRQETQVKRSRPDELEAEDASQQVSIVGTEEEPSVRATTVASASNQAASTGEAAPVVRSVPTAGSVRSELQSALAGKAEKKNATKHTQDLPGIARTEARRRAAARAVIPEAEEPIPQHVEDGTNATVAQATESARTPREILAEFSEAEDPGQPASDNQTILAATNPQGDEEEIPLDVLAALAAQRTGRWK